VLAAIIHLYSAVVNAVQEVVYSWFNCVNFCIRFLSVMWHVWFRSVGLSRNS